MNPDIKTGTMLFVGDTHEFLPEAIQAIEGSMWHHMGIIVRNNGVLWVFEEKTLRGPAYTLLSDYIKKRDEGKCKLAFANIKNFDTTTREIDIQNKCLELAGMTFYRAANLGLQIPRQLLQRIGIDWKFKQSPKNGFICSGLVLYILNLFFKCFPDWSCYSPDDAYCSPEIVFIQE